MNDRAAKIRGLVWIGAAGIVGFLLAFGLPALAGLIPWRVEEAIASAVSQAPEGAVCESHPKANEILRKVIARIHPVLPGDENFPLSVQVISGATVNAFAGLGGHIYVYNGLLQGARTPEELAGVLAHEIEHVRLRHIAQGVMFQLLTFQILSLVSGDLSGVSQDLARALVNMHFTRTQEAQADEGALKRLNKAKADTKGFREFFERMSDKESVPAFISDHPASEARISMARKYVTENPTPLLDKEEWEILLKICSRTPEGT